MAVVVMVVVALPMGVRLVVVTVRVMLPVGMTVRVMLPGGMTEPMGTVETEKNYLILMVGAEGVEPLRPHHTKNKFNILIHNKLDAYPLVIFLAKMTHKSVIYLRKHKILWRKSGEKTSTKCYVFCDGKSVAGLPLYVNDGTGLPRLRNTVKYGLFREIEFGFDGARVVSVLA